MSRNKVPFYMKPPSTTRVYRVMNLLYIMQDLSGIQFLLKNSGFRRNDVSRKYRALDPATIDIEKTLEG